MVSGRSTTIRHAMFVLLLAVTILSGELPAGITTLGSIYPSYGAADPWVINDDEFIVGFEGDGTLSITAGSDVTVNAPSFIGDYALEFSDITGTLLLTGSGSTLTIAGEEELFIGPFASGYLTVADLAILTSSDVLIGGSPLLNELDEVIGVVAGDGHATVSGGAQWSTEEWAWLTIGAAGFGELTITGSGSSMTAETAEIGLVPDAVGQVLVDQSGSWSLSQDLTVGIWGDGSLTVSGGGEVQSTRGWVGGVDTRVVSYDEPFFAEYDDPDGTGQVTVAGDDSLWDAGDALVVGATGTGTLDIEDGGTVTASLVSIGGMPIVLGEGEEFSRDLLPDGTGRVTVTGEGSLLEVPDVTGDEMFFVGYSGTGTLNVEAGGDVTGPSMVLGGAPDAIGTVVVTGSGSTLSAVHEINVGAWGTGQLTVSAGGSASTEELLIGGFDASDVDDLPQVVLDDFGDALGTGTVTVTGAGSTVQVDETTYVGNYGAGTLNVAAGGQLTTGEMAVGVAPGSQGAVNISGAGSSVEVDEDVGIEGDGFFPGVMIVGGYGTGEVTVSDGGQLTVEDVLYVGGYPAEELDFDSVGYDPDGTGTVTITGEGSTLAGDVLSVGYSGEGTLEILNEAEVTSELALIGVTPDGVGHVVVDNAVGTWTNTGSVVVGVYGEGDLTVSNNGHVVIGETLYLGGYEPEELEDTTFDYDFDPDGTGTVTVTGSGSLVEAAGIGVGVEGTGTLEVLNGGEVKAEAVVVGLGENGTGEVLVDGTGSILRIQSESMDEVPLPLGEGNVVVSNGGQVIVDGAGVLAVADKITVGSEGEGTMTISDGGTVTANEFDIGGVDPLFDTLQEYVDPATVFTEGDGAVTVTGAGSSLDVESLVVGFAGSGTLNVEQGGSVTSHTAFLGGVADAVGTAEIGGASTWNAGENIVVGLWGQGDLTISGASEVTTGEMYIGGASLALVMEEGQEYDLDLIPDGTGTVTVTGDGSTLNVTGTETLYVGYAGTGVLDVSSGGDVTAESVVIGAGPEVTGTVTVDGTGSTLSAEHEINVGAWGTGQFTVSAGGSASTEELIIGGFDASDVDDLPQEVLDAFGPAVGSGTVTVTGALSTLEVAERIYVGNYGEGTLNVNLGGDVIAGEIAVGVAPGSQGTVNISGTGSSVEVDEDVGIEGDGFFPGVMIVGGYGDGTVAVSEGGLLAVDDVLYVGGYPAEELDFEGPVGQGPNGTGTVTISGEGSTLQGDMLAVGYSGQGTLNIINDATAVSEVALIGVTPDGVGVVNVDNSANTWTNTDSVVVGAYGDGTLTVSNGGHVAIGEVLYVGGFEPEELGDVELGYEYAPNGTGTMTVTGVGSLVEANGIGVGVDGTGTLEILNGAEVQAAAAAVGMGANGVGEVLVDGDGSLWAISSEQIDNEVPAASGEGNVVVSNGGQVLVDGTGLLNVADKITIGSEGEGTMTISGGTVVAETLDIGGVDPEFDSLAEYFDPEVVFTEGSGEVTVTGAGSSLEVEDLMVGMVGSGTLDIDEGASVTSDAAVLGVLPDASGTVRIGGASTWNAGDNIVVGLWGQGDLTISGASEVTTGEMYIGGAAFEVVANEGDEYDPDLVPDGTGAVTVTGAGSTLNIAEEFTLYVGYSGTGTLTIEEGGQVSTNTAVIGGAPDVVGTVNIDNGSLTADSGTLVGAWGTGNVTLSNEGTLTTNSLQIGGFDAANSGLDPAMLADLGDAEGTGVVTVSTGASLQVDGTAYVGSYGVGTLTASEDGEVRADLLMVGTGPEATGTVTVNDATLEVTSNAVVGAWGQGNLTVSSGGHVSVNTLLIGGFDETGAPAELGTGLGDALGTGTVAVTGAGSVLDVTGTDTIFVGYSGDGTLEVLNGGQVNSRSGLIGLLAGSEGQVDVNDGAWDNDGDLYVGNEGQGTLRIVNGGQVSTSGTGYLAFGSNGLGLVRVSGEGSLWEVGESLFVGGHGEGSAGDGTLQVADGGEVVVYDELYVWDSGRLEGDGTITVMTPTTLHNYGTIAPGDNGVGTLTVNGSVIFHEGSTFAVDISNTGSDRLAVDGGVTIEGGTVQVNSAGTIMGEHDYEIISADAVSGEFDDLDTALLDFSFSEIGLDYSDASVWLHVAASNFDDPNIARTDNQRAVAGALQDIGGEGGNDVTDAVQDLETADEVRNSYDQLSGQTRPALAPMAVAGSSKFLGTVTSRVQTVKNGLVAGAFDSRLMAAAGPDQAVGGNTAVGGQNFAVGNGSSVLADRRWGLWGRGYGLFGDRDTEGGVPGYDYDIYGGSFGVDYQFSETLLAGLVGGISEGDVDFSNSRDNTDFGAAHIGLYGSLAWDVWNVDAVATYANLDYETRRFVDLLDEQLLGNFDGSELAAYVEVSRDFDLAPSLTLSPLASLQYTYVDLDSYTETGGASALSFDDQTHESVRGSLGARLTKRLIETAGDFQADVQVRGRWVHEFGDDQASIDSSFATDPTVVFTIKDEEISRDSAVLGAGFCAEMSRQTRVYVDYDTRLNSDESIHVLSASLQYRW